MARTVKALCAALVALVVTGCRPSEAERRTIRFNMPVDGFATIQVKSADGHVVCDLGTGEPYSAGENFIIWDGRDNRQMPVPPGEYRWSGVIHAGIAAKMRGWACGGFGAPWPTNHPLDPRGADGGVPSAVATDADRVYLGWSATTFGAALLACDLDGKPLWGWWRAADSKSLLPKCGIKALAVDEGVLFALGGEKGVEAEGGKLFKLNARDGTPIPWPDGRELTIASLWPADAKTKPGRADGMAARAGRIYLTFTEAQFLAVLDAQTGAYLQTVVGAPPELIDVVPTKTESNDKPGELMPADFALISLRGGVLGKVLFAHDPLWVVVSDMQPLEREERITALTVIGDGAKHHPHSAFVGLGAPFHQVQRRSVLNTEGFLWSAGRAGGRQPGPWVPEALGAIRCVALDVRGRLWIAEADAAPPRFSVWETDGNEGRLVREFFGPVPYESSGAAIVPGEPDLFVGAGCEWRLDPQTGESRCTGVISRTPMRSVRFRESPNGKTELVITHPDLAVSFFERVGEGRYEPRGTGGEAESLDLQITRKGSDTVQCGEATPPGAIGKVRFLGEAGATDIVTSDDLVVARLFEPPDEVSERSTRNAKLAPGADFTERRFSAYPFFMQAADGRVYAGGADAALWNMEVTGLESIRPLPGGKLSIREAAR